MMKLKLMLIALVGTFSSIANALPAIEPLATFSGNKVVIDANKITHLVFIDLWRSYEGNGDEKMIASLGADFLNDSQQIWIQPALNVTIAQLAQFQQYFPQVTPLVLDHGYQIMHSFDIWQSPYHVLLKDGVKLFSGHARQLQDFINGTQTNSVVTATTVITDVSTLVKSVNPTFAKKPLVGNKSPIDFQQLTSINTAKNLSVIFLDSLCP
ncbi:MAG: hypothetical protein HRU22_11420, partial [Gammaproteobacteria bacterium]|nr:hypothetical protein [Gammaproteobacteria bacterium]